MKKILYTSFALLFIVCMTINVNAAGSTYYTNYNNIEMTEHEYNNLVQLGFTENEIYLMDLETFNDNKDIEATLVSENVKYYKTTTITRNGVSTSTSEEVTKDEYTRASKEPIQSRASYDGIITTNYKTFRTNISYLNQYEYRYKSTMNWTTIPSTRSYDIIAIGFQQALVQLNSTIYFQQQYTNSSGNHTSITCTPLEFSTGASAVFKLPTGTLSALSSYIYYDVTKADDNFTITEMEAGGDYSHATSSISQTNAKKHSVNHGTGIVLDSSIEDYYDGIPVATALWYGTW